jgi:hypothetical protein
VLLTEKLLGGPQADWSGISDDRRAVQRVAETAASTWGRITAKKPTPEYEDMFGRLSEQAMTDLKERFGVLRDALIYARDEADATKACKRLRKVFGNDFPCLEESGDDREAAARRTGAPAIVTSSSSA